MFTKQKSDATRSLARVELLSRTGSRVADTQTGALGPGGVPAQVRNGLREVVFALVEFERGGVGLLHVVRDCCQGAFLLGGASLAASLLPLEALHRLAQRANARVVPLLRPCVLNREVFLLLVRGVVLYLLDLDRHILEL